MEGEMATIRINYLYISYLNGISGTNGASKNGDGGDEVAWRPRA